MNSSTRTIRRSYTMNNTNTKEEKVNIEKFEGSFSTEQGGCSIFVNSTVNLINCIDAAGIYLYLMCRPSGWKLNAKQLMQHFDCGRDKIYKCLTSLKDLGLLTSELVRDKTGKFSKPHYTVHLHPQTKLNKEISPRTEKPYTEKPDTVNQDTYKTKNIKNKDNKKTTTTGKTEKSNSSSVITPEIDKKLLSLRDEYIYRKQNREHDPDIDRSDEEFLRQCSHHLDNGDKQKYNLVRRLKGLETIIKSGFFETPAGYKENKIVKSTLTPEENALLAKYQHGLRMSELGQSMNLWVTDKEMIEVNKILNKIKANEQSKPLKLKDILAKGIPV